MDIAAACNKIREAFDFTERRGRLTHLINVDEAVLVLRSHLEDRRYPGIERLHVSDDLKATRAGLRELMPFVLLAEARLGREATEHSDATLNGGV